MLDIVIRDGTIVDGTGSPGVRGDVGLRDGKVVALGDLKAAEAGRVINAHGLTVTPGFVDTHTHSDGPLLIDPQHECGLRQGITTELLGIDGMSYAPLSRANYEINRRYLSGILGHPPLDIDTTSVAAFRSLYHRTVAVNTAYLVPHGAVRLEVLGFHDRPLVGADLERACEMVREGIRQGAVGFAAGLTFYPSAWSDTAELVALATATREAGGIFMTELRGPRPGRLSDGAGLREAMDIARQSGVSIHIAHFRTNAETAGETTRLLAAADEAKADGVDCTFDIYPYPTGGGGHPQNYLLPSWANDGGPDALIDRLTDPSERARIIEYIETDPGASWVSTMMVLSYVPGQPALEGLTLSDVARARSVSMGMALCELMVSEDLHVAFNVAAPQSVGRWRQVSKDALTLLARPDYMACTDITPLGSMCHPRSFGSYPRFLGRLRREFGGMSLETMVSKMTDVPARRFGLTGRGRIQVGYYADVTVFDADRLIDTATYDDPRQTPVGIPFVIVNGRVAVDEERCTGVLAGESIP